MTDMTDQQPFLTLLQVTREPAQHSFSVYAVVSKVSAGQQTAQSAKRKSLTLVDPSCPTGLLVSCAQNIFVKNQSRNIIPGNILRISHLVRDSANSYSCDEASTTQIPSFEYDYENRLPQSFASQYFSKNDSAVVKHLEEWYAEQILSWNFSNLTKLAPGEKKYMDFACQVLEQRATKRNVNLTVWDGQQPDVIVNDNFRSQYCDYIYGESYGRRNEGMFQLAPHKHVFITIWKNESQSAIDHYHTCSTLDISGNAGLLLFLNAEVACAGPGVSINLRSGHHQGKAVRVIRPDSVLGRQLHSRLSDAVFEAEFEACEVIPEAAEHSLEVNDVGETTVRRSLTPEEEQLISLMPPHMSITALVNQSGKSLDSYERLIHGSQEMNFPGIELSAGFGKEQLLRLLNLVKLIRSNLIEIDLTGK